MRGKCFVTKFLFIQSSSTGKKINQHMNDIHEPTDQTRGKTKQNMINSMKLVWIYHSFYFFFWGNLRKYDTIDQK